MPAAKPKLVDKIEGHLEVGALDESFEVVINHFDLDRDANGVGHIVFSPRQARHLARLLNKHARAAEKAFAKFTSKQPTSGSRR